MYTPIVQTPTRNQVGQNLFWKNRFWVGPDGGPKLGGGLFGWGTNFWVGHLHDFLGGALNPGPNYGMRPDHSHCSNDVTAVPRCTSQPGGRPRAAQKPSGRRHTPSSFPPGALDSNSRCCREGGILDFGCSATNSGTLAQVEGG